MISNYQMKVYSKIEQLILTYNN